MTQIVERLAAKLELPGLRLSVVSGADLGKEAVAESGVLRVGAARDNDLVLSDPSVSRRHFQVTLRQHEVRVDDLGSTNGTFVQGVRILSAILAPGSLVQVGNTAIRAIPIEQPVHIALSEKTRFGALLGTSVEMRRVFALLERVSPSDATVLIQGETGTGKELVAEAIHAASPRADQPFVTFDCGSVAPSLVESELFGHVRGAFSGAVRDRLGVFEAAHGGTLFLDEIGELPLDLQPKLLRALESRQVQRVGENRWRSVDVRVVAATHRELAAEVNRGRFREDLYFRLAVVPVHLPPLRARGEDVPMLIAHFWQRLGRGAQPPPEFVARLASRAWPGNVRELRNAVERAALLGAVESLGAPKPIYPSSAPASSPFDPAILDLPLTEAQEKMEELFTRAYLERALTKSGGSVSGAARSIGTNRRYVQRLMKRYAIKASDVDDE
ncbi:sigma 54-interacting transcriptional regulator [Sandaracinus amylolyticus]|uniref:Response regulator of zinc sigma-54-dependent two-component system n=1 Tax=Sandaracinus amylolyticus TaxID=927083 RepID=A0A0F6W9M4_9BACT|nr:sigma 54-interacting transcriptional regulator [Sandaracinus amylolyticus]AKF10975.1 Response regulator of zinc sigma-54-dependent two-component system [Sandaracinus amylolyticus]